MGAGGAGRAAAFALKERGLAGALYNRTVAKAEAPAEHLGERVTAIRSPP